MTGFIIIIILMVIQLRTSSLKAKAKLLEKHNIELMQAQKNLELKNIELQRLATAIEAAAEGVIIIDRQGIIRYFNKAYGQITGYTKEDMLGKKTGTHYLKIKDSQFNELSKTTASGKLWSGQISATRKNGTPFALDLNSSPIRDSQGKILGRVSVLRDITIEKKMEQQLQQSQKLEAIGTLAGGIAHDFNNILAGIMGYTELSTNLAEKQSKQKNYLTKTMKACERAAELVQQILSFSRQSGQELSPVSLIPVVKEVLKLIRASIPSTIDIQQKIADTDGLVMANQTQIHQVTMNLCTNAAHAMENSEGVLSVSLEDVLIDKTDEKNFTNLKNGRHIKLTVSDTGCGIPPDIMNRIFEPFFTTKEVGKGTGMGLSVLHGIVATHKGEVKLYSEPGKGTTFHVYFPIVDKSAKKESLAIEEDLPKGNEKIIIVDDEENIVSVAKQHLEELGYKVVTETSSTEVIELFSKSPYLFDLVISDMTMPKMTGLVLAEKLRVIRSDIPIIICSGLEHPSIQEQIEKEEINAFLPKPFSQKNIAELVHKVLSEYK